MTVPVQTPTIQHIASGVSPGPFAFPFKIMQADDLQVFLNGVRQTAGYTITGVGNDSGGDVTFGSIPASGTIVLLKRHIPLERVLFDYQTNGDLLAGTVNSDFDRIWMALQDIGYYVGNGDPTTARALLLGDGDVSGAGAYRALQNRIQDVGDAVAEQDAVNYRFMIGYVARLVTSGAGDAILDLLALGTGANLIGYGSSNVGDTLDHLVANSVNQLARYAELENYVPGGEKILWLRGGYSENDGNAGLWRKRTDLLANTANIGTRRLDADGVVWERIITDNILNPWWFKDISTDTDFTVLQRAFNASITLALPGVRYSVVPPAGSLFTGTTTLAWPSFLSFQGNGLRGFVINYNGTGTLFQCATGMEHATIGGFRIGLGSSATAKAFDLTTASGTTIRKNKFHDIEIAGAAVAGQIGINQTATVVSTVTNIISENEFTNIVFVQVDKPVQDSGSEGNYWRGFVVDGFGYTPGGSVAFNMTSHANFYQGRIAGAPTAGSTAVTQGGNRNEFHLVVDIGASSKALDISGVGNGGFVSLPEGLTPIGNIAANNQIKTSEIDYSPGAIKGRYTIAAAGTITTQGGIAATCVRNSAGNYTLTMSRVFVNCRANVQVVGIGGAAFAIVSSITTTSSTTSINFVTINTSGSGAGPASSVFVEVTADN